MPVQNGQPNQQIIDMIMQMSAPQQEVMGPPSSLAGPQGSMGPARPWNPGPRPIDAMGGGIQSVIDQLMQAIGPQERPQMQAPAAPMGDPNMQDFSGMETAQGALGPAAFALLAKQLAEQRGFNFTESPSITLPGTGIVVQPGMQGFANDAGKLSVSLGDEFLDLQSIRGNNPKASQQFFELLDELADIADVPARRGTTGTSEAAQASILKQLEKGRLVKNPGGAGFVSTGSRAGRAFADKAKNVAGKATGVAKNSVSGVSALLAPLFGAIQDPGLGQDLDPGTRNTLQMLMQLIGSPNVQGPQG